MEDTFVKISDHCIAQITLCYHLPVILTPNFESRHYNATFKGETTVLSSETYMDYFQKVFEKIKEVHPDISRVKFLSSKYRKRPFEISGVEWKKIEDHVAELRPRIFKNAEDLYAFCEPAYDY